MWCVNQPGGCGRERLHGEKDEWDSELKILVIGGPGTGKTGKNKTVMIHISKPIMSSK